MGRQDEDYADEFCFTAGYILEQKIDVRCDGKPVRASATWCAKHDCWIASCAYRWFLKANPEVKKKLDEQYAAEQTRPVER